MWGGACSPQEGGHPAWKRASFSTHMINIYLKVFVISMCSTWQRILMNLLLHFCRFCSWAFGARISPLYRPLFHPIMFSRTVSILLFLSVPHTRFQPLLPWDLFTGISVWVSFLHDQTSWLIQLCGPPTLSPNQYYGANDWNRELARQPTLINVFAWVWF